MIICTVLVAIVITAMTMFNGFNIRMVPFIPYARKEDAIEKILNSYKSIKIIKGFLMREGDNYLYADYIIILPNGKVAVITECNIRGNICGGIEDEYWHSELFTYRYSFMNPVKDNRSLVKTLQNIAGEYIPKEGCEFVSMIVFPSASSKISSTSPSMTLTKLILNIDEYTKDMSDGQKRSERIEAFLMAFNMSTDEVELERYINYYAKKNTINRFKFKRLLKNTKKLRI